MIPPTTTIVASNGPSARRKLTRGILRHRGPGTPADRETPPGGPAPVRRSQYNDEGMARGWESKGVEAQQADREQRERRTDPPATPEEAARLDRRRTLELARARAARELAGATRPAHRRMLDDQLRRA
jgi:hypothetical protein